MQRLCAKKVPLVMLLQEGELTFEDLLLPPHTPSHEAQTSGRPAEDMADLEHLSRPRTLEKGLGANVQ